MTSWLQRTLRRYQLQWQAGAADIKLHYQKFGDVLTSGRCTYLLTRLALARPTCCSGAIS